MERHDPTARDFLSRHALIRTDDPERMREVLFDVYEARRFDVHRDRGNFLARANRIQFERIGFDYCAYGAEVEVGFPPVGSLRQQICLSGAGETVVAGRSMSVSPAQTIVIPAGEPVNVRFNPSYRQLVLRVDADALRRKLEIIVGRDVRGAIEVGALASFRSPKLRSLRRLASFFADEANHQGAHFPMPFVAEFEEALLVAFLYGHDHNFSQWLEGEPLLASSRQFETAEDYIVAHWREPITIESIAAATGISGRSLFRIFKQSKGRSPMSFLKDIRLSKAHELLSRAEGDSSVMEVALACGFQSHSHFAREYRIKFGQMPSETPLRARKPLAGGPKQKA